MAAKKESKNVTAAPAGDKKAALETALAQIEKQFGKGAVMKLGANVAMQVDSISTGSLGLDMALGVGGLPRGRIIEIYGPESSGKTTLALHVLAEPVEVPAGARQATPEFAQRLMELMGKDQKDKK